MSKLVVQLQDNSPFPDTYISDGRILFALPDGVMHHLPAEFCQVIDG